MLRTSSCRPRRQSTLYSLCERYLHQTWKFKMAADSSSCPRIAGHLFVCMIPIYVEQLPALFSCVLFQTVMHEEGNAHGECLPMEGGDSEAKVSQATGDTAHLKLHCSPSLQYEREMSWLLYRKMLTCTTGTKMYNSPCTCYLLCDRSHDETLQPFGDSNRYKLKIGTAVKGRMPCDRPPAIVAQHALSSNG